MSSRDRSLTLLTTPPGTLTPRVERSPSARPYPSRKALPESPGTPGETVVTMWVQPLPSSPPLRPTLGESSVTPSRVIELPYENPFVLAVGPVVVRPFGPPQWGIEGLTLATSRGSIRTSARSLYAQASGL